MNDTSPEKQKLYHKLLMQKSDEERFLMGMSMCDTVKQIVLSTFPDTISEPEKKVRLLYRYYSHDFSKDELEKIEQWLLGMGKVKDKRLKVSGDR